MMPNQNTTLSGMEKIAILMNVLGKERSIEIMKLMKDSDVRRLLKVMGNMKKAPITVINQVLSEFLYKLNETEEVIFDENLTEPELITQGLGEERAKHIFGTIKSVNLVDRKSLSVLEVIDPKSLAEFLVEEHPQTISLIIAHMEPDKQIQMIKHLPDAMRPEIVSRMANLEFVSPEKIEELDEVLRRELLGKGKQGGNQFGGVAAIADLINSLDKRTMNSLMTRLEDKDPILAEEIRQYIFSFNDIIKIDVRGLQLVLREVPNNILLLALKNSPDEIRDRLFSAMSERAAAILKDDLQALGPQRISDVEKAQKDIVVVVKRLEEEGKIIVGIGEDSDMVP